MFWKSYGVSNFFKTCIFGRSLCEFWPFQHYFLEGIKDVPCGQFCWTECLSTTKWNHQSLLFTACKVSGAKRFLICCSICLLHVLMFALETEITLFQATVSASKQSWRFFSPLEGKMQSKPWGCCIKGTVISKQCMWTAAVILQESSVTMICSFIAQVHILQALHRNLGAWRPLSLRAAHVQAGMWMCLMIGG